MASSGAAGAGGSGLEAWYDSLASDAREPRRNLTPDTDGLLGGRYRGTLTAPAATRRQARPFVPDEVAEVAELGGALEDLLPAAAAGGAPAVGRRWTDSAGLELRRLADSAAGGG